MGRALAGIGEIRSGYKIFVGRSEGERPLGRPRHRWEDSIKMHLKEIKLQGVVWLHLAQDRDQWQVLLDIEMNICLP
jgi:hypothetical protein